MKSRRQAQDPTHPLLPGATVGVFGSGQLGRMLALAARPMGYGVHTYSPGVDTPTGQVAEREVQAPYDDLAALAAFVSRVDVITFEFENIPAHVAAVAAEAGVPVRPGGHVLHTVQNRLREKEFLSGTGLPVTAWAAVGSAAEMEAAIARIGVPAVLKTAAFGYDGKGQTLVESAGEGADAWRSLGEQPAVLEAFVDFEREVSTVAARGVDGSFAAYPTVENRHDDHILDVTLAPADVPAAVAGRATDLARQVLEALDAVGVVCVEFFHTREGDLLINEIAPRPHNSGHWTIEGAVTSQFEQQLRAACGLPLGSPEQTRPAVMCNLLGDLWQQGEPRWPALLAFPTAKLHLYGKREARPGRKMGHVTVTADTTAEALEIALAARSALVAR